MKTRGDAVQDILLLSNRWVPEFGKKEVGDEEKEGPVGMPLSLSLSLFRCVYVSYTHWCVMVVVVDGNWPNIVGMPS